MRGVFTRERIRAIHHQYYASVIEGYTIDDPNLSMQDIDESQLGYYLHWPVEERGEVHFKDGATYTGQWLGNMKHGYGVQVWKDGAKYEGYWKDNKAHG